MCVHTCPRQCPRHVLSQTLTSCAGVLPVPPSQSSALPTAQAGYLKSPTAIIYPSFLSLFFSPWTPNRTVEVSVPTLQYSLTRVDMTVTPSYASKGLMEWPSAICRKIIVDNEQYSHGMPVGFLPSLKSHFYSSWQCCRHLGTQEGYNHLTVDTDREVSLV